MMQIFDFKLFSTLNFVDCFSLVIFFFVCPQMRKILVFPFLHRSVTCITNNLSRPQAAASASAVGFGGPSSLTTSAATGGYMGGRVTICTTGPGASSPTKSMSSGSMSGIVQDPTLGREVVTVNVNQINEDLIRQVGAVSNTVNPPASHSYLQGKDVLFLV